MSFAQYTKLRYSGFYEDVFVDAKVQAKLSNTSSFALQNLASRCIISYTDFCFRLSIIIVPKLSLDASKLVRAEKQMELCWLRSSITGCLHHSLSFLGSLSDQGALQMLVVIAERNYPSLRWSCMLLALRFLCPDSFEQHKYSAILDFLPQMPAAVPDFHSSHSRTMII